MAAEQGLSAIAITDHDVLDGVSEATAAGHELGIEIVPGVELTAAWQGRTVHVLGYLIDPASLPLVRALAHARDLMTRHVDAVLERLNGLGETMSRDDVARYRSRYPGGAGLVLAMVERGTLRRVRGAAEIMRMASREPRALDAAGAIQVIHAAGGLASLAHPVRIRRDRPLLEAEDVRPLVQAGLDGIEVWQIVQPGQVRDHYQRLARDLGLVPTGGSDCHGPTRRGARIGSQNVAAAVLEELKQAHARRVRS
jgi:predicted metal-dependent phosphoesterase TrpH